MKGKITNIIESLVKLKDGTQKKKYLLSFEGDDKQYETWSCNAKIGDEVSGEVTQREYNNKTYYGIKLENTSGSSGGSSGYARSVAKAGQPESFAAAYAKDIAVACINAKLITKSTEINATLEHYYAFFMDKLNP